MDLENVVHYVEEALDLTPAVERREHIEEQMARAGLYAQMSRKDLSKCDNTVAEEDWGKATGYGKKAVEMSPTIELDRHQYMMVLDRSYVSKLFNTNDLRDLDEVISGSGKAFGSTIVTDESYEETRNALANSLLIRYERRGRAEDLDYVISLLLGPVANGLFGGGKGEIFLNSVV